MDFRILGPLEVDDGERSIELGGARQRALLAILLLHRNAVVSSERLVEDLYGGKPPATAAKSLQAHMSRMRSALRPQTRLQTRAGGYSLEVRAGELDVDRVTTLLAEGKAARVAGQHDDAADAFAEALRNWRGEPLADVAYDGFAQDEIARLEELRLECLAERLDTDLDRGRHSAVAGELESLVARQPLRERLRAQLMLALYRCGRQADALAVYQDARRALSDELGLEPGRALQELERAILNQDPLLDLPIEKRTIADRNNRRGRRTAGVFVGRKRELNELAAAFDDARSGTGRFVLLAGEAGIGKSRVADELAAQAQERGATVLWGRCWEAGGAPAYWPWVQALRPYVRNLEPAELRRQLGAGLPELAHLLPDLRERFPDVAELVDLASEGSRFRLFDAMATFLRIAAERTPLVLVLDDLHVADAPSLLMLRFVAAGIGETRAMLLGIYRDPSDAADTDAVMRLTELQRLASVRIGLRGLTARDVVEYVNLAAELDAPPTVTDAILRETEGNPLFMGEVVRLLAAEGRLDRPLSASWHLTVPRGVRDVIERRLEHVSPECMEILALAAVLGREFGLDALERLSEVPYRGLLEVLDQAATARVVIDVPGSPGRLRFAHALIRDTLYDGLTNTRRLDLHRRAGEVLEGLYARNLEPHLTELAHHFFLAAPAGDAPKAIDLARRAGDQASRLLAYEEAARLYELALSLIRLDPAADELLECRLQLTHGEALARGGDRALAKDAFLRAAALARSCGDADALAIAALGYGGRIVWGRPGNDRLVVPLLEEALAVLGDGQTALRARVLARLAGALRDDLDPRRRIQIGEQAVAAARAIGEQRDLSYALSGLCAAQHGLDNDERRLEVARELRQVARAAHDIEAEFDALSAELLVHASRNEFGAVREKTAAMTTLARPLRQPSQSWLALAMETMLALHTGRFADAERLVPEVHALGEPAQDVESRSAYAIQLYLLRRERGPLEEALDPLVRAAADNQARPFFRCALAALAVELGDRNEARRLFEELAASQFAILPRDNEWLLAAAFLAETGQALGDRTRLVSLYEHLAPHAWRSTSNPPEGSVGSVARTLGSLAAALGRDSDAITHLRHAIELDTAAGATPWVVHAKRELSALLEPSEAATLRADALRTAVALGMEKLAARLETSA